ncbi:hypothetical protein BZL30_3970 [Mycobacterium kansasii]|uniref:Uncharacterized protein n=2 Tax=Mycobacterium kansasii TaxID=1768 RepID=A0A1V3XAY1_MYCKA|nr:hypothetical protein MKAN_14675 [Mycobacterium kansasii ATCC 12478]OOK76297.1 hypothetical protein BZL30_3970 [Mycobacterium kansasii]
MFASPSSCVSSNAFGIKDLLHGSNDLIDRIAGGVRRVRVTAGLDHLDFG